MKAQEQFSKGFKLAMKMEGLNKSEVSRNAGISRQTLRRTLQGKTDPLLSTLEDLCMKGLNMRLTRVFHLGGE